MSPGLNRTPMGPAKVNGAALATAKNEPGPKAGDAQAPCPWDLAVHVAAAAFFTSKPAPRDYILRDTRTENADGVLVAGKVGGLVAEGGVGKTQTASDLAVAVATGGRWLGCLAATKPGRVLLVLGEEDVEEAQRRGYASCLPAGTPVPADGMITVIALTGLHCAMLERDERGNVTEAPFLDWLRAYLLATGPYALVVLDPLTRFAGPEAEKDNAQATRFVQAVESLVTPSGGATVLVAHHTNKVARGGGDVGTAASRGSSALTDGFRWVASMSAQTLTFEDADVRARLGEIVTVAFTKSNYSKRGAPVLLRRGERGSLVPLDEEDMELIREAKSGTAGRVAKTADREAERDRTRAAREAKDAERRATVAADREAERRQRDTADDATVAAILARVPDMGVRDLRAAAKGEIACGSDRADAAIRRVRLAAQGAP